MGRHEHALQDLKELLLKSLCSDEKTKFKKNYQLKIKNQINK
jgi:hypothetical protein